jgi:hypothetical protein
VWLGVLIGVLVVAVLGGAGYLLAQSLSDGDEDVTFAMPRVIGATFDEAKAQLEAQGLVVVDPPRRRQTDEAAPDTVVAQDPKPDEQVVAGDEVTLTVAVPIQLVRVPDLTGMTLPEAQAALDVEGLVLGTRTEEPSDDFETGEVISQIPLAGEEVGSSTSSSHRVRHRSRSATTRAARSAPSGRSSRRWASPPSPGARRRSCRSARTRTSSRPKIPPRGRRCRPAGPSPCSSAKRLRPRRPSRLHRRPRGRR